MHSSMEYAKPRGLWKRFIVEIDRGLPCEIETDLARKIKINAKFFGPQPFQGLVLHV